MFLRQKDEIRTIDQDSSASLPSLDESSRVPVCVAVNAFPVLGGIRAILTGIEQVTADTWRIEYLTRNVGLEAENYTIHQFGTARPSIWQSAWQFPFVWLYVLAGCWKLITLLRQGAGYRLILPQDGVFTSAYVAPIAKLAGVRVVCIDHGALTLMNNPHYRKERLQALARKSWPVRLLGSLLFLAYWPSLHLLAWIAARFVDHYLIPGVAGDGVEEVCRGLGISPHRLTRFGSMIDLNRHPILDMQSKARLREQYGIAANAIVVTLASRFMPEKGLDIAVKSIESALAALSPALRQRVRVIFAGDGPLRVQIEQDIQKYGLSQCCQLCGNLSSEEVFSLFSISDIFLNTTVRGTCLPMSILEAMASGCAVVATKEPLANACVLAEGRGIIVSPGDVEQTSTALMQLVNDAELRQQMGHQARAYIAAQHSPLQFRRTLFKVTHTSGDNDVVEEGYMHEKG